MTEEIIKTLDAIKQELKRDIQTVNENINQKLEKQIQDNMSEFKKKIEKQEKQIESIEREIRKQNILINDYLNTEGVKESWDLYLQWVRQQFEEKLGANLLACKKEIDNLVMEYVSSKENSKKKGKKSESKDEGDENKEVEGEEEDEGSEVEKKGSKKGGATAGGGGGGGGGSKHTCSGFTKPMTLSPELAALVGQNIMARHEVIKRVWAILKERDLYDPKNRQYAICDDALFKVIGVKRFRTFGMMKYLKRHFIS